MPSESVGEREFWVEFEILLEDLWLEDPPEAEESK